MPSAMPADGGVPSAMPTDGGMPPVMPTDGGAPRAMPTGMLMPAAPAPVSPSPAASTEGRGDGLRVTRGVKGGAWVELQQARASDTAERRDFEHWRDDSRFVSLEAITRMHEPFARALPGFDLFLPRLFDPSALAKLATELDAFSDRSTGPMVVTSRELATLARAISARAQSLWVLPP